MVTLDRIVACIILTKNEAVSIKGCLEHLRPHVDHILVLDGESTDNTVKIARKHADKIVVKPFSGSFSGEKNHARTLVPKSCNWILWVDADERFDSGFLENLKDCVEASESLEIPAICFRFPRINLPDAKNYPDYQVRLFKNSRDIQWFGDVHETPYITTGNENIPLDRIDEGSREERAGVITLDAYPIIHLQRRTDLKRPWW